MGLTLSNFKIILQFTDILFNETVASSNNTENKKTILSVDIERQPKEKLNLIDDENNYIIDLNNDETDDQMQVKDPLALHSGDGQLDMNQFYFNYGL